MGRVDGKVALISGGARGMGASHARALVAKGARIIVGDILDNEGKALAEELGAAARFAHLDVTQPDQWKAAVDLTLREFGTLNVLVNNAGIFNCNTLQNFPLADWQKVIDINLTGTFLGMQAAVEPMIAAGGGSIINISSVEGLRGCSGDYGYVASKFGVRGLAKTAALELAPHNIRVNSIHPGLVRTPMTMDIPEGFLQIPLGRGAESGEVSACVVYLASDESSYSTGAEFLVDGGLTTGIPHKTM
ncbi:MAG: SDR family oxidoreductase [Mycobacterium sp.]|nr:SDR family oxidoreductase [Mycobacterium sp.]